MRALVQRVSEARVTVGGTVHARTGPGLLILLGVTHADTEEAAASLAAKCAGLRIFEDAQGKMNLSVKETAGEALVVSQFTLYADTRRGNRPGFSEAAAPQQAEALYETFCRHLGRELGPGRVATGVFRAMMQVALVNDGPVTVMVESREREEKDHA